MKKKKTYLAAVVLLLLFVVGGAIAYFTDTDTKTNVFTIGSVDIELIEPSWVLTDTTPSNGVPDAAENLMPGQSVDKDPTIRNLSTKNDAYVFAKVEVPCSTANQAVSEVKELFTYDINDSWTELVVANTLPIACTNGTATHVYYYGTAAVADPATPAELTVLSKASDSTHPTATSDALFDEITLNSTLTGKEGGLNDNKSVVITAYGIQTEGLDEATPAEVWSNFSN